MYRWRIDARDDFARIEIGINDPERWEGKGGMKFGFEAEVHVSRSWTERSALPVAEVSMAAIGTHTPAEAMQRADVYLQAAMLAEWLNAGLRSGDSLTYLIRRVRINYHLENEDTTEVRVGGALATCLS